MILLKTLFDFIVLVSSMRVKIYQRYSFSGVFPLFTLKKVHICMSHSQPINYIVYSVMEKACTGPDRFIYFLDYHCIGQQVF